MLLTLLTPLPLRTPSLVRSCLRHDHRPPPGPLDGLPAPNVQTVRNNEHRRPRLPLVTLYRLFRIDRHPYVRLEQLPGRYMLLSRSPQQPQ
jgi:hypothetical protein